MTNKTQAAYVAFLERELKRVKQDLKEHQASEHQKDIIIARFLDDKRS